MSDRTAARMGAAARAPGGPGGPPALRAAGHDVVAAPDGTTAFGLVGTHWQPDLLLLGARFPDLDAPAFLRAYAQTPRRPGRTRRSSS